MTSRLRVSALIVSCALLASIGAHPGRSQTPETAGMITELKVCRGRVEVKSADGDWRPAAPLSALRAGDQVRAVGNATAVVLLTGGRGTVLVKAKGSPYTIAPPRTEESTAQRARTLLSTSFDFTSGVRKPVPLTPRLASSFSSSSTAILASDWT